MGQWKNLESQFTGIETCDLLTNYHSQTPLLLRATGFFTFHIPQVTMRQINKQDQKCLLGLIPIQNVLFGWGETIWSSYLSTKQRAVIVTCGGHGNMSIWLVHSILNSLYNTQCLYPPTQMFFWLVIQSFPNKFSWERNEWQSPKNINVAWEGRLSFPHMFWYSHALCPLTHAGHSLKLCKEDHITAVWNNFCWCKKKARKDSGLYIWFSPFCHYHAALIFSFWSFFFLLSTSIQQ